MSDPKELTARADQKLEENAFADARDLYRAAALMAAPSRTLMGNLSIAEDEDRLQFHRLLSQRHQTSIEVRLAEANALTSANHAEQAIRIYTQVLEWENIDAQRTLETRLSRFRAARRCGDYQALQSDFSALWKAGADDQRLRRLRPTLLQNLAQLQDVEAIGVLQALCEDASIDDQVKHFLQSKIAELRSLAAAIQYC